MTHSFTVVEPLTGTWVSFFRLPWVIELGQARLYTLKHYLQLMLRNFLGWRDGSAVKGQAHKQNIRNLLRQHLMYN